MTDTNDFFSAHKADILSIADQFWPDTVLTDTQMLALQQLFSNNDALVISGTGTGKSRIFQLFALVLSCKVLIICPLVSLINDQIRQAHETAIPAIHINNSVSIDDLPQSGPLLMFTTMESIVGKSMNMVKNILTYFKHDMLLIVADECHVCAYNPSSFRPEYQLVGRLRDHLPDIPLLALTATICPNDIDMLKQRLGFRQSGQVITGPIGRTNLHLQVSYRPSDQKIIEAAIQQVQSGSKGIVYVNTPYQCERLEKLFQDQNVDATIYHGKCDENKVNMDRWLAGQVKIIVATSAFGLGINCPDCRFVIHCGLPLSPVNYVQEVGRAGRDGLYSKCHLYVNLSDIILADAITAASTPGIIRQVLSLLLSGGCRNLKLNELLGGQLQHGGCNNMCDNCLGNGLCLHELQLVKARVKSLFVKLKQELFTANELVNIITKGVISNRLALSRPAIRSWIQTHGTDLKQHSVAAVELAVVMLYAEQVVAVVSGAAGDGKLHSYVTFNDTQ